MQAERERDEGSLVVSVGMMAVVCHGVLWSELYAGFDRHPIIEDRNHLVFHDAVLNLWVRPLWAGSNKQVSVLSSQLYSVSIPGMYFLGDLLP